VNTSLKIGYFCAVIMRRNLSYLLSLCPAIVTIWGNFHGGWWTLGNLLFSFGLLGIAEIILPSNTKNEHTKSGDAFPEFVVYLHVIAHTLVWMSLFYGIYHGILRDKFIFFAALSSGAEAGSGGIIVAHELVHKASSIKQFFGKYLLATSGNIYFFVHHLRIHHRYVGTHKDAATARENETLYHFVMRTMRGQTKEAWESESVRLRKINLPTFHFKNIILQNVLLQLVFFGICGFFFSWTGIAVWLIYIAMGNILLEYVNYIEHYGLVRDENVRVNETHSWNSDKVVSRFFLVELSRHSDHHHFASKPYHTLESNANSPMLPGGYASMVLPALIPPLWRAIVHPKLAEHKRSNTAKGFSPG